MKKYFQAPWPFRQTILILALTMGLIAIAIGTSTFFDTKNALENSNYRIFLIFGTFILQWVIVLGPLMIITHKKHGNTLKIYGIKKTGVLKTLGYVFGGYMKYIGIIMILSLLILYSDLKIPGFQAQENIIPIFGEDTFSIIIGGIIAIGIAPFVEEIFFRGFLLRAVSDKWGIIVGNITTAALFAVFHMQWQSIIPIFILGIIINSITIRSKSIIPAIGFHIFNNAIAFTLSILIIKDIIPIEKLAS